MDNFYSELWYACVGQVAVTPDETGVKAVQAVIDRRRFLLAIEMGWGGVVAIY